VNVRELPACPSCLATIAACSQLVQLLESELQLYSSIALHYKDTEERKERDTSKEKLCFPDRTNKTTTTTKCCEEYLVNISWCWLAGWRKQKVRNVSEE